MQLDNIMQEKMKLTRFAANISDGVITTEELASDYENMYLHAVYINDCSAFLEGSPEAQNAKQSLANFRLMHGINPIDDVAADWQLESSLLETFAKQAAKKIALQENQLELQQKKLETQLTAAQKQLDAVEQAEGQAIQAATPKFTGLA